MALQVNRESTFWRARGLLALSFLGATLMFLATLSLAQQSAKNPSDATLRITGKVDRQLTVQQADLQALPRKRVSVTDDRGARVTYEGVPVVELLQRAGVPLGKRLRGAQMKSYVIVDASDGYQVVFALPEFDPGFTDRCKFGELRYLLKVEPRKVEKAETVKSHVQPHGS